MATTGPAQMELITKLERVISGWWNRKRKIFTPQQLLSMICSNVGVILAQAMKVNIEEEPSIIDELGDNLGAAVAIAFKSAAHDMVKQEGESDVTKH